MTPPVSSEDGRSGGVLRRLQRWLRFVEDGVLALLLTAMIGMAAYQVLARNLLDGGVLWGDAMVRVLVLWVAMFGAMVASRNDDHIRIDAVTRFLPDLLARNARRLTSLFTCVVLGAFAYYSFEFVREEYEYEVIAFGSVPAWACEAVMPFGAAIMSLRYLLHVIDPPEPVMDGDT